ncbi:hypothetical protein JHL17_13745 [Azospirillum sp. YIM B02556]|uniref:Iron uptake protein n=1 Tax=Azospirillum endophyticum TaxID=2800326 RepID=A0ABS1F4X0_9PROT|nr:hypothetical protein [Azospirillum endophyticum]MBK1838478.1 hypothetical protein [Azospirillum endophyticum]
MTTGGQPRQPVNGRTVPSRCHTAARVTAAVFGAYGFAWGLASFGAELGALAGMAPAEAVTTSSLLALLVLPVVALWAFAVPRVVVGWAVLGGGGVLLTVAARLAGVAAP